MQSFYCTKMLFRGNIRKNSIFCPQMLKKYLFIPPGKRRKICWNIAAEALFGIKGPCPLPPVEDPKKFLRKHFLLQKWCPGTMIRILRPTYFFALCESAPTLRKISLYMNSRQVCIRVKYAKSQGSEALPPNINGKKILCVYFVFQTKTNDFAFQTKNGPKEWDNLPGLTPP